MCGEGETEEGCYERYREVCWDVGKVRGEVWRKDKESM